MIVEFFGPPCVGKTTLAQALYCRLEQNGWDARLISSYRPDETGHAADDSGVRTGAAALRRLIRAVVETGALMRNQTGRSDKVNVAGALLELIPQTGIGRSARMNQYLSRLAHNWQRASASRRITVFDQGFVQAVYSLAQFDRHLGRKQLDSALSQIPMPDLLIGLSIPKEVLSLRLDERQRRQGWLERLLETSPARNLASLPIFDSLEESLRNRGIRVMRIKVHERYRLDAIVQQIEEAIQSGIRRRQEMVAG